MQRLESRVKRLEAQIHVSERKVSLGDFGYATLSEIRELVAAIYAKGPAFEMNGTVEARLDQRVTPRAKEIQPDPLERQD